MIKGKRGGFIMDWDRIQQKLHILSDAAKYDVSCSSSGSRRANQSGGIGNGAVCGICHTWSAAVCRSSRSS